MAAPTYSTDLTLITAADTVTGWTNVNHTGSGAAGLNDETDYYIEQPQCISKNGFTAATKGPLFNAGTTTITSGDAVFIWIKQNNRNLLDTQAAGGIQVVMGSSTSAYDQWYVDGNDSEGSELAGWRTYAVDPTTTSSNTTGSPGAYTYFGAFWKILGSGSLKGAPNGIDVIRHGRELRCVDGDAGNGYATFDGAATFDAAGGSDRAWGILTPSLGAYWFHGAFVMGQSGTSVDFRDSNRNIVVLEDPFVASTFNEMEIQNASSNVEWTNIQISHLGTTSPTTLTLNVGTFTGDSCRFDGCGSTTFASTGSCTNTTWANSGQVVLGEADISGSSILTSTVAADEGAVYDNRTTSGSTSITELNNCTFSQGTNAHHAIRFGANVTHDITLTGIEFSGFSSSDDVNGSTLRFDATSGSINCNLVDCTVDGNPATTGTVGVDDAAGITVTLVVDPVTTKFTVQDEDMNPVQSARVLVETGDNGGGSGFPYQAATSSLTQTGGTATLTASSAHGLASNDYVVVRGANDEYYNKVAQITVTSTTVFTYSVNASAGASAGGTPVFSYAPISGTTDINGEIQSSKTWPAAQSLTGWARKSTSSPYYKQSNIAVSDASGGTNQLVTLQLDE